LESLGRLANKGRMPLTVGGFWPGFINNSSTFTYRASALLKGIYDLRLGLSGLIQSTDIGSK
jgi:hypothetical protein